MPSTNHTLNRIQSSYPQFSEKEKLVADYIVNNPDKIIHSSISQVADDLGVSDATVFRFCRTVGYKGYQALKIALASEIRVSSPMTDIHEKISVEDDEKTIAVKVFQSNIRTLDDTMQIIDGKQLKKAIDAIVNAKKIELYGNGGSGIVAMDGHHKLLRIGIPSVAYTDSHLQIMSASQLSPEDVVILISHSGASKDILEVLEVIKKNGATSIGITNFARSPLSKSVDIPLFTVSQETEYRPEASASRLAQLSILDALFVNVSVILNDKMKAPLQKMRNAISLKRV